MTFQPTNQKPTQYGGHAVRLPEPAPGSWTVNPTRRDPAEDLRIGLLCENQNNLSSERQSLKTLRFVSAELKQ